MRLVMQIESYGNVKRVLLVGQIYNELKILIMQVLWSL
jgi:hypothetical protein